MNIILLSGGSGKRLWPLSNDIRSKQFIKLFRKEDGTYESMIQRMYRMILNADPGARITVATSKTQVSAIHNQLGENAGVSVEPCRRDTFPAIALAAAYLHDVKGVAPEETVVVCPADPFVDEEYFESLKALDHLAQTGEANLYLMGMEPTYPSEKYGYILPENSEPVSRVLAFKEKPVASAAAEYIAQGGLWNGGVFAFRLSYILDIAHRLIGFSNYYDFFANYENSQKISFDYAVAEKEKRIGVLRFKGKWMDLGTWNTLTEAMDENLVGKAVADSSCSNVHVLNELNVPVIAMGLKNIVISASPEGILVSDKEKSSYIKPYVDAIDQQVMFAEKSWGNYQVLDVEESSMTVKVNLQPGHRMHYHSHQHRNETWTVVEGEGIAVLDDAEIALHPGIMLRLPMGCRHTVIARTAMTIIEVQIGENIAAGDKMKYSLEKRYGKHR